MSRRVMALLLVLVIVVVALGLMTGCSCLLSNEPGVKAAPADGAAPAAPNGSSANNNPVVKKDFGPAK